MAVIGFPSAAHTGNKTIKKTWVKENTITWYSIVDEDKILPILCDIFMRRTNIKFLVIWSIINSFVWIIYPDCVCSISLDMLLYIYQIDGNSKCDTDISYLLLQYVLLWIILRELFDFGKVNTRRQVIYQNFLIMPLTKWIDDQSSFICWTHWNWVVMCKLNLSIRFFE